jgi:multidrug resistance protein, MATE family
VGYWGIGLGSAWLLGVHWGFGIFGLWCGLIVGLAATAAQLLVRFHRLTVAPATRHAGSATALQEGSTA